MLIHIRRPAARAARRVECSALFACKREGGGAGAPQSETECVSKLLSKVAQPIIITIIDD